MNPWKIVTLSSESEGLQIIDAFERLFIAAGGPIDAALYESPLLSKEHCLWFSPAAAEIAAPLLESVGAKDAPAPDVRGLVLLSRREQR